jgi:ankyrin repeat protein
LARGTTLVLAGDHAISENKKDIAELLLAKSTDFDSKDNRGLAALHNVAVEGYPDITELLLDKGASVDERDDVYEFTALYYAARFGNKNVAEVLIAHGADINAKDKWGYQPIHVAAYHDRSDVVELLIENWYMHAWSNKIIRRPEMSNFLAPWGQT